MALIWANDGLKNPIGSIDCVRMSDPDKDSGSSHRTRIGKLEGAVALDGSKMRSPDRIKHRPDHQASPTHREPSLHKGLSAPPNTPKTENRLPSYNSGKIQAESPQQRITASHG